MPGLGCIARVPAIAARRDAKAMTDITYDVAIGTSILFYEAAFAARRRIAMIKAAATMTAAGISPDRA
jgi:hypothetical protein